jgi:activator of 2-hydroxyglutaryl-CoA dehydratase
MSELAVKSDDNGHYYWGVDCGSSEIKVVLCDE